MQDQFFDDPIGVALAIFVVAIFAAMLVRVFFLWMLSSLSFKIGANLSDKAFENILRQDVLFHSQREIGSAINTVFNKTNLIIDSLVIPVLVFLANAIICIFMLTFLFYLNAFVAGVSILSLAVVYLLLYKFTRRRQSSNGQKIALFSDRAVGALQSSFSAVEDVHIFNTFKFFQKSYSIANQNLRTAQAQNKFLGECPRPLVETFGMILICGMAIYLERSNNTINQMLPVLGVLVLGLQRLLPLVQQMYGSLVGFMSSKASISDFVTLLDLEKGLKTEDRVVPQNDNFRGITVENLCFTFNSGKSVLNNVNVGISAGERVGLMGPSGEGKSTFANILLGLIQPTSGRVVYQFGDQAIESHKLSHSIVSHVPQKPHIFQGTIVENIAYSSNVSVDDLRRLNASLEFAELKPLVGIYPDGVDTVLREGGASLSGGQAQRMGIARAIFNGGRFFVFDEATNALDREIQDQILVKLRNLDRNISLLVISHHKDVLELCDRVYKLEDGGLVPVDPKSL